MNDIVELPVGAAPAALSFDAVPVGTPLDWPIVDSDGTLLFDAGAILVGVEERKFLFDNFRPQRGDVLERPLRGFARRGRSGQARHVGPAVRQGHASGNRRADRRAPAYRQHRAHASLPHHRLRAE